MVKDIALRTQPVLIEGEISDTVYHKPRTIIKTFLIEAAFYPAMLVRVNCGGEIWRTCDNLERKGPTEPCTV